MACTDTTTNTCAEPILTTCVDHEAPLGANTKITQDCVNQSNVNTDLYAITDEIISGTVVTSRTSTCIDIPIGATEAEVEILYATKICELENRIIELETKNLSELDITSFNLNFNCLVDPCGGPITELGTLLQIMINKSCE